MKKALVCIVCMIMFVSLTSCRSYYEKEEIGAALAELIPASMPLNEIYFGEGLPFADEEERIKKFFDTFELGETASNYYPVSESCGYENIEEIKEATRAVYSEDYCEYLFTMAFSGISDVFNEGTEEEVKQTAVFARYIEQSGILTRRVLEEDDIIELNRTYDVSDFTVIINREEFVTAEVQSYVNGKKDTLIEIKLVLTPNGWRLDSPTY
ncbi:MAG: hypothetical protein IJ325_12125 [Clostridia bacterium]|nr:hypothetical protein [Clostridia bacterium]